MHINFLKKKKKRQGIEIKLHKLLLQPIYVKFSLSFNMQCAHINFLKKRQGIEINFDILFCLSYD